jgi:hypothetical protein
MYSPALAGDLTKITITTPTGSVPATAKPVVVMFNPRELTPGKAAPWKHHDIQGLDTPALSFTSGRPFRIGVEMTFDTSPEGYDVRELTEPVRMAIFEAGPNPINITWDGVKLAATVHTYVIEFIEYDPSGIPVVASMYCVFDELAPVK